LSLEDRAGRWYPVDMKIVAQINLELPDGKTTRNATREEIAAGMDAELSVFQDWFMQQGNHALIGPERSILKSYLAWKVLYENRDVGPTF
jgi:hypothetical protein